MEDIILAILLLVFCSIVGIIIIVNRVINVVNSLNDDEYEDFEI